MPALVAFGVILAVSIFVVRLGSIALRKTGLRPETASFQAYSAFFGVGFTTREAELVVNHPVRRRIIQHLILAGNVGLTSALATVVVTFLQSEGWAQSLERALILGGVGVGLFVMTRLGFLVRLVDLMIEWSLRRMGMEPPPEYELLLRVEHGYGVMEFEVPDGHWLVGRTLGQMHLTRLGVTVLGIQRQDGAYIGSPHGDTMVLAGDVLTLYGREDRICEVLEGEDPLVAASDGSSGRAEES